MVWRATVGLFVGVAIAAGVLLATHSSPASPPARSVAAADLKAPSSLVKAANKEKAQMVVMGTHGHGILGRALLGSVAQNVLTQCEIPVLLVK